MHVFVGEKRERRSQTRRKCMQALANDCTESKAGKRAVRLTGGHFTKGVISCRDPFEGRPRQQDERDERENRTDDAVGSVLLCNSSASALKNTLLAFDVRQILFLFYHFSICGRNEKKRRGNVQREEEKTLSALVTHPEEQGNLVIFFFSLSS